MDADLFSPKYSRWMAIVSLIGIGLVIATRLARSFLTNTNPIAVLVLGVLPNFGAGLALPFAGMMWTLLILRIKRWNLNRLFAGMAVLTFTGLLVWETVQLVVWGYPFDINDIVATAIGVLGAVIVHCVVCARNGRDTRDKIA
ncbi:MAG: hypothetical protein GY832_39185 [Chloroflexi bacterium]|nr:hypothetical protein [Chloroflexota bacterium]